MYARMIIGEGISEQGVRTIRTIYEEHIRPLLAQEPGLIQSQLLLEEGGTMLVILTIWHTREQCLRYQGSSHYRQYVAQTQHLLVGDFVVKLFEVAGGV